MVYILKISVCVKTRNRAFTTTPPPQPYHIHEITYTQSPNTKSYYRSHPTKALYLYSFHNWSH